MSLAKNVEFLRRLRLSLINGFGDFGGNLRPDPPSLLIETAGFGSNPGQLRMFSFLPEQLQQPPALVVVLHGCGQTAASYDLGAGWSTLARHYGFALLMPEQQSSNNSRGCFNCSIRKTPHAITAKPVQFDRWSRGWWTILASISGAFLSPDFPPAAL